MILITGATGFLGAEVARQLATEGHTVRCIHRKTSRKPKSLEIFSDKIDWFEADLLELSQLEDALVGIKQVYHCAAFLSFDEVDKNKLLETNITGTANLVNLCLQKEGIRLLHVSSVAALGETKPGELISENTAMESFAGLQSYAISKYEGEMEVWRGVAEGLEAVIVNPSIIIGKSAGSEGSGKIFETVRKGLSFYTRGGCGFVDVEDVARIMILLMNSEVKNERFVLNAENWRYKDLLTLAAKNFGKKPPQKEAKPWMMELAWRASAFLQIFGIKLGLDKVSAKGASLIQYYDNSKLKAQTGFQFKKVERTVEEVCEGLMANGS